MTDIETRAGWEVWNNQPRIPVRLGVIFADDFEDACKVAESTYSDISPEWLSISPADEGVYE